MARYAAMWSGGKDSSLAVLRARRRGLEVDRLLNFHDPATGRVRFHATRLALIEAQARAMGLPLRSIGAAWADFDRTFRAAVAELAADGVTGVVFGDIHLTDVRTWYEDRVRAAGLEHVEPLWGDPPDRLLAEFVGSGSRAVVTCCETAKLDESWLGRIVDERFADEIADTGVDPCGENGEYHSFAFAGPLFTAPVAWRAAGRLVEDGFVQLDLEPLP